MIDIERLLIDLHIEYGNAGSENVKINCLNPEHDDKSPSMLVHRESGIIHCFSCNASGSIFTLLKYKGITGVDAYKYLLNYATNNQTEEDLKEKLEEFISGRREVKKDEEVGVVKYGDIELPTHRMIEHNFYLEKRGITKEDMLEWKMAVVTAKAYLGWILIPIYQNGILRNYFLRSTYGMGKIYGKYPRHDLLPGIDFAADTEKPIYVVEGIFDAISVRHAGYQAVATLSNKLLPAQLEILKKYKVVILMPDNDKMGYGLVKSAASLIYNTKLYVCTLPLNKKDAADCIVQEILEATHHKAIFQDYVIAHYFSNQKY